MPASLQELLARPDLWRATGDRPAGRGDAALATGHPALDAALHERGWPRAALSELLIDQHGIGELQLLAPALRRCGRQPAWRAFLVCPPARPYAPALERMGIDPGRVIVVSAPAGGDAFWACEQILRGGRHNGLLAWLPEAGASMHARLRRLQLAAQGVDGPAFLFRPRRAALQPSPAALRLQLGAEAGRLAVEILKQRGGWAGQRLGLPREPELLQPRIDPRLLPAGAPSNPVPARRDAATAWRPRTPALPGITLN